MGTESVKAFRVLIVSAIAGGVAWVLPHLMTVHSQSIRYSLLWVVGGPGAKGDYVTVPVSHPLIVGPYHDRLTKRIGCVAGDVLRYEDGRHYCNGQWMGTVLKFAYNGTPLKPFLWNGPVPAGKV